MRDIENREDLYLIVKEFYVKLMNDAEMHHFFVKFDNPTYLEKHLQILVDFWDSILFYSGKYQQNAMKVHLDLQDKTPFETHHFKKWIFYFEQAIDGLFKGENAHTLKTRALSIATVMQIKVSEKKNS